MTPERALRLQTAAWIGVGVAALVLLYLISPVLAPFLSALILAYILNPLVEQLVRWRFKRALAVMLTVSGLIGLSVALPAILLPLIRQEGTQISQRLPDIAAGINDYVLPWLRANFGIRITLNPATVSAFLSAHLSNSGDVAGRVLANLGSGGLALVGFLVNLILTPLLVFYLLQDWPRLVAGVDAAIPRPWHDSVQRMLGEVDQVLSEFLRGELLVMMLLALYYSGALWLADLGVAIPVGIVTGLLIFIPYVGYGIGLVAALLVALLQFQGWPPIVAVLVIYGIGQVLEGFLLTPYLVGERIGLHPMAVIFALLAFGQLFGFVGILLALPASAALLVALRELKILYFASHFYRGSRH